MVDDSFGCPRSWSRCSPGGTSHRCWTRASPNQARTTPYSSWNFRVRRKRPWRSRLKWRAVIRATCLPNMNVS